jgi:2-desacetyl-2-hydroxyethyl bacteriochlorophyllide A dehydrogenase
MRALQILKPREFKIVDIPHPARGDDEIVVKLEFAAVCNQNDYKIFYGLYGDLIKYPCDPGVYGHEGAGVVAEKGKNVKNLEIGDRVVMMLDGGPMLYSEYVLRKADSVALIDKKIPAEQAAALELFGCARHCVKIAGDVKGKVLAVNGLGPAGLAITQLLKLKRPKSIIGVDISAERLKLAGKFGADKLVNSSNPAELENLIKEGADLVVDATGVPKAILNSFEITRKEVVIFGFTNEKFEVDQSKWFHKEMVIKNSKVQTLDDLKDVVKLLEDGKIKLDGFISGVMSFDEYDKAVEKVYKKEAVKLLLKW